MFFIVFLCGLIKSITGPDQKHSFMNQSKILTFAGSTRSGSFNKKLIRTAAQMAGDAGAEITQIDLRDYSMPLYDGDLENEHGLPENAKN